MKLSEAKRGWKIDLEATSFSPNTVENYMGAMEVIITQVGDKEVDKLIKSDVLALFTSMRQKGRRESTIACYWKTLRSFYRFAIENEIATESPVATIKTPRGSEKEILPFSQDELPRIIAAAKKSKRNRAMIMILLDAGLRASELCRLRIKDYDQETGALTVIPFSTGKKSRGRQAYLGKGARRAVWQYLVSRGTLAKDDALIASSQGDRQFITADTVLQICKRVGRRAGIINCHPHRFRHTFAIEYLRGGGDVYTLMRIMGHSSLSMTRRYLTIADSDAQAAHTRASPVDRLKL